MFPFLSLSFLHFFFFFFFFLLSCLFLFLWFIRPSSWVLSFVTESHLFLWPIQCPPSTKHVIHSYSAIFPFTDPQLDKLITKHLHQQLVPHYLVHWPLLFPESWRSEHTPQCVFHSCAQGTPHDPMDPVARQAEQHQLETASHGTMGTPSGECQWILLHLCLDLLQVTEGKKKNCSMTSWSLSCTDWANLMRTEKSLKPTSHAQSLDGDITFCAFP